MKEGRRKGEQERKKSNRGRMKRQKMKGRKGKEVER